MASIPGPKISRRMFTSPRRIFCVISNSARRVLPTRVVPSTSVAKTFHLSPKFNNSQRIDIACRIYFSIAP